MTASAMTVQDPNHIKVTDHGTSINGPDGMLFYAACSLKTAINLYRKSGMQASRYHTPKNMLDQAAKIMGKTPYKRGQLEQAQKDLEVWIETMRAALPRTDERTKQD